MTDSDVSMNLDREDATWRTAMQPALDQNLMAKVVEKANLQKAWQRVKSKKGAPGSDGMTLEDFPAYARLHWPTIRQSLLEGTYRPQPVRRVSIPKPNGRGERLLGVPCVVDRVIQQAILQVLTPIFDPSFSASSFGSRPQRSAHGAIAQIKGYLKAGHRIAVDVDLEKFFDTVHHDVLFAKRGRRALVSCFAKGVRQSAPETDRPISASWGNGGRRRSGNGMGHPTRVAVLPVARQHFGG
jgi:RNA-directed DNA polymerase